MLNRYSTNTVDGGQSLTIGHVDVRKKDYGNGFAVITRWECGKFLQIQKVESTLIKKKINFFPIHKEIQSGAVAKSNMRKGFPIYEEMRKYFPVYKEAVSYI